MNWVIGTIINLIIKKEFGLLITSPCEHGMKRICRRRRIELDLESKKIEFIGSTLVEV